MIYGLINDNFLNGFYEPSIWWILHLMSLLSYYTFAQSNVSNDTNDIYFTKYPLLDSLANENRYLVCRYFRYVSKLSAFVNFKNNLNHNPQNMFWVFWQRSVHNNCRQSVPRPHTASSWAPWARARRTRRRGPPPASCCQAASRAPGPTAPSSRPRAGWTRWEDCLCFNKWRFAKILQSRRRAFSWLKPLRY